MLLLFVERIYSMLRAAVWSDPACLTQATVEGTATGSWCSHVATSLPMDLFANAALVLTVALRHDVEQRVRSKLDSRSQHLSQTSFNAIFAGLYCGLSTHSGIPADPVVQDFCHGRYT